MMSFTGSVIRMRGKVSLNSYRSSRMLSTVAKARTQNGTHESQSPRRTHLPQGQRCRSLRGHQLSISRRAPCTSELTPQTTPARTYRRAPGQPRSELAPADVPVSNAGYPGNGLGCPRKGPAALLGQLGLLTSRQLLAHSGAARLPLNSRKPHGRWGSPTGLASRNPRRAARRTNATTSGVVRAGGCGMVMWSVQKPATECNCSLIPSRSDRGCGRRRVGPGIARRLVQSGAITALDYAQNCVGVVGPKGAESLTESASVGRDRRAL